MSQKRNKKKRQTVADIIAESPDFKQETENLERAAKNLERRSNDNEAIKSSEQIEKSNSTPESNKSNQQVKPTGRSNTSSQQLDSTVEVNTSDQHVDFNTRGQQLDSTPESNISFQHLDPTSPEGTQVSVKVDRPIFKSRNQQYLFSFLSSYPNMFTNYKNLSELTDIPKATLRDVLRLFEQRGLISKKPCIENSSGIRGLHIIVQHPNPTVHSNTSNQQLNSTVGTDSKIDRSIYLSQEEGGVEGGDNSTSTEHKLLSLSNSDIQFYWPHLARYGFSTHQINQIIERLKKVDKSLDYIFRSLDYAEWELENGQMTDKNGNKVKDPNSFVFNSLAKTGYYRRPAEYVSPEEQAEEDARKEAERLKKAREKREHEEFETWKQSLSREEYDEIMKNRRGPEEIFLKHYWKTNIKSK